MKKLTIISAIFIALLTTTHAQALPDTTFSTSSGTGLNVGLGFGIDYGGIGIRFTYLPVKSVGPFVAVGFAIIEPVYNVGVVARLLPKEKVCPYGILMYGYNAVIKIEGASEYDKTYYGPSGGIGIEFHTKKRQNYWNLEFLITSSSTEYDDDMRNLKSNPNITFKSTPSDFRLSIGFHFGPKG